MTTTPDHHQLLLKAHEAGTDMLASYFEALFDAAGLSFDSDNVTELRAVIENAGEAGYQQAMLELTRNKHKRDREEARETLRDVVASTIASGLLTRADLKNVFDYAAENGEQAYQLYIVAPREPGGVEKLEAALFRGWQGKVQGLRPPLADSHESDDPSTERGALIAEIHANAATRNPLGIAQQLAEVVSCLACEEAEGDRQALDVLDYLAIAEERAALSRSGKGPPLGEGGVIYNVSIDLVGMPDAPTGSSDAEAQAKALMQWVAGKPIDELRAIAKLPGAAPPWVQAAADREMEARGEPCAMDCPPISKCHDEVSMDDTAEVTDNIGVELL